MNVVHILKDGTVTDTVKGLVIQNAEFYEVLKALQNKKQAGPVSA